MVLAEEGYSIHSIAGSLKAAYAKYMGVDLASMYDHRKETFRKGMIEYATKMRLVDPDIFLRDMIKSCWGGNFVTCDDERYPNEFEALNMLGACQIRIKADIEVRMQLGMIPDEWIDNDTSETGLDDVPDSWFTEHGKLIDNPGLGYRDLFEREILDFAQLVSAKM